MKKIPLSLVIITHKSNAFLSECLRSIIKQRSVPNEIIVIDNNSPESPLKIFQKALCDFRFRKKFIENKRNLGFASAANMGCRLTSNKIVLFLNPDLLVKNDAIGKLFQVYKKHREKDGKKILAMGGKSISWKKTTTLKTIAVNPNFSTLLFEFTSLKKIFPKAKASNSFWDTKAIASKKNIFVSVVSGNFLLVNKKLFVKLGKFDENFFLYLEDLDFCMRASGKGYKIMYVPKAIVKHFGGGSSRNKKGKINQEAWNYSKRYFVKKWFGAKGNLLSKIFDLDDLLIKIKKFTK